MQGALGSLDSWVVDGVNKTDIGALEICDVGRNRDSVKGALRSSLEGL